MLNKWFNMEQGEKYQNVMPLCYLILYGYVYKENMWLWNRFVG